jgi:hypothetical protein
MGFTNYAGQRNPMGKTGIKENLYFLFSLFLPMEWMKSITRDFFKNILFHLCKEEKVYEAFILD